MIWSGILKTDLGWRLPNTFWAFLVTNRVKLRFYSGVMETFSKEASSDPLRKVARANTVNKLRTRAAKTSSSLDHFLQWAKTEPTSHEELYFGLGAFKLEIPLINCITNRCFFT